MKKILCLLGMSLLLQGCDPVKFWNGHYSMQSSIKEYDRKEKAYYDKETPEQKRLRKENRYICRKMAMDMYLYIPDAGYETNSKITNKRWAIEKKCMKERGTPEF